MPKRKKLPDGADTQHTTERYEEPRVVKAMEDDEDLQESIDFSNTSADLFRQLVGYMYSRGIKAVAVPGGSWAGFELYAREVFNVPGLNVPENFNYWRALKTYDDADRLKVKEAIQACATTECLSDGVNKQTQAKWLGFVEAWTAYMANERTSLFQIANGLKTVEPYRTRTFKGASGYHVVCPPMEWFPEAVQTVSPYDLLSILPEAEADMLMLNFGRIVVGHRNQECAEGHIEHDYRYFCGVIGGANLGKSRLMEWYIKPALVQMGCKVETWNLRKDNPFGWARRACADTYILSDVPTSQTIDVITDPQQKILSSGEAITTEEKGAASVTIEHPTAGGFVFLANGINIAKLQMLDDDGVTDRFKCLLLREHAELKELYGLEPGLNDDTALAGMTGLMWERIAKQTGASTMVLALYLLSVSAQRFLTAVGYEWSSDGLLVPPETLQLKHHVTELTDKLRMGTIARAKEDTVRAVSHGIAYCIAQMGKTSQKSVMARLHEIEFNHHVLLTAAAITCKLRPTEKQPWLQNFHIESLAVVTVKPFLEQRTKDLTNLVFTKDPLSAFEFVASMLKTKQNLFGFPSHPIAYGNLWRSALVELPILVRYYESLEQVAGGEYHKAVSSYNEVILPLVTND